MVVKYMAYKLMVMPNKNSPNKNPTILEIESSSIYKTLQQYGIITDSTNDFSAIDTFCCQFGNVNELREHLKNEGILEKDNDNELVIRADGNRPYYRHYKVFRSKDTVLITNPFNELLNLLNERLEANDYSFFERLSTSLLKLDINTLGDKLYKFLMSLKTVAIETRKSNKNYLALFLKREGKNGSLSIERFVNSLLYGYSFRNNQEPQVDGFLLHVVIEAIKDYNDNIPHLILMPNHKYNEQLPIVIDITRSSIYKQLVSEGIITIDMDYYTKIDLFCCRFSNVHELSSHLISEGLFPHGEVDYTNLTLCIGASRDVKTRKAKNSSLFFLDDAKFLANPDDYLRELFHQKLTEQDFDFFKFLCDELGKVDKKILPDESYDIISRLKVAVNNADNDESKHTDVSGFYDTNNPGNDLNDQLINLMLYHQLDVDRRNITRAKVDGQILHIIILIIKKHEESRCIVYGQESFFRT